MSSPYSPPKAALDDIGAPPLLPRWVRVLRGVAVAGSFLVAVTAIPLATVVPPEQRLELKFVFFTTGVFLFGVINIFALTSQLVPRLAFWSALVANGLLLAFLGYRLYVTAGQNMDIALIFGLPELVNFAALIVLRRARERLASG